MNVRAGLIRDRAAVVTGAGRGIGRAIAELFVAHGARVLVNDIDAEPADQTVASCRQLGEESSAHAVVGSVSDPDLAKRVMASAFEHFGGIDILVNNAGITRDAMAHKMTDERWREVIDVNLSGTFYCVRASAPYLREAAKRELAETGEVRHHRKIVNLTSTAAIRGNIGQINYAAAKAGNLGLTRSLAREWAPLHVNVNAVAPGFTDTRLTRPKLERDADFGIPESRREELLADLPFGRPASPLAIAQVVLFLASPLSDWVTGQQINVSGGYQIP